MSAMATADVERKVPSPKQVGYQIRTIIRGLLGKTGPGGLKYIFYKHYEKEEPCPEDLVTNFEILFAFISMLPWKVGTASWAGCAFLWLNKHLPGPPCNMTYCLTLSGVLYCVAGSEVSCQTCSVGNRVCALKSLRRNQ